MHAFTKALFSVALAVPLFAVAEPIKWPALPKTEFISGRVATLKDIDVKKAAFVSESGGKPVGKPLKMKIPQYAYYIENKKKIPVIVIQAEEVRGQNVIGARRLDGKEVIGALPEFKLLGTKAQK